MPDTQVVNTCIVLARRPQALAQASDFELADAEIPSIEPGQMLVRTLAISLDPYMASAIQGRHMSGAVSVGQVMPGDVVGVVEESLHADFQAGDTVLTRGGWRAYSVANGDAPQDEGLGAILAPTAHKIHPSDKVPATAWLGVLGMPGLTAYALMSRCLKPREGETVAVFAATGAVGSVIGQIARRHGARAVAIVGNEVKAEHALSIGYDAAVIRGSKDFSDALSQACPNGINALVSNDSGAAFSTAMDHLAMRGRVALLGDMSQYNSSDIVAGPPIAKIVSKRATVMGFVVFDHFDLMSEWQNTARSWIEDGSLIFSEDRTEGIENAPDAFARLMRGDTMGKTLVIV